MATEPAEKQAVYLAEFDRLREEIDNRTQLGNNMVLAQLTAFGAGISFYDKVPDVLVGLAAISCFLWLLWLDHTEQIYKIAAYIGRVLSPRLSAGKEDLLGWEHFLRIIDHGGPAAAELLFGQNSRAKDVEVHPTRQVGNYIMLLLGGSPTILLLLYGFVLFQQLHTSPTRGLAIRWLALSVVVLLWIFAYYQYRRFKRTVMTIDDALHGPVAPLAAHERTRSSRS